MPDADSRQAAWESVQPFPALILTSQRSHRHFAAAGAAGAGAGGAEEVDRVGVCCDEVLVAQRHPPAAMAL